MIALVLMLAAIAAPPIGTSSTSSAAVPLTACEREPGSCDDKTWAKAASVLRKAALKWRQRARSAENALQLRAESRQKLEQELAACEVSCITAAAPAPACDIDIAPIFGVSAAACALCGGAAALLFRQHGDP
jgi:hypothetical protein